MRYVRRMSLAGGFALSLAATQYLGATAVYAQNGAEAAPQEKAEATLGAVTVTAGSYDEPATEKTGSYTVRKSSSATRLEIPLQETPQSVSVVTRAQMDDFGLNSANDVLANTTGVIVEKVETDRTYYSARGFDIVNFQYDGIGTPFSYLNAVGDVDTAIYDRVEVVRGANGLISATGNPSATINFVRKRPTDKFQAGSEVTIGSWGNKRIDADVAGPLTKSGNIRARLVAFGQQSDSYLDRYSVDKTGIYSVVEADLGYSTLLTLGHSQHDNKADSPLWGALPLYFNDGTPTDYDRSTSTATEWAFWNNKNRTSFVEISHRMNDDWQAKAIYTRNDLDSTAKLFYAYGTPDRETGLGLFSYPSLYDKKEKQNIFDVYVSGAFPLAGRKHEVTMGVNWSRSKLNDVSHYGAGIGTALPDLAEWGGDYPEPAFDAGTAGSSFATIRKSAYGAVRFAILDDLKLLVGVNATEVDSNGESYGTSKKTSASNITPYVGVVYNLTPEISLYTSYAEIFNPQSQIDINGQTLDPLEGRNYEVGVKTAFFDKKLNASFALFKTEQDNAAESAGFEPGLGTYYQGMDSESQGLELDASGNITDDLQASAGYTLLSIKDDQGRDARTYTPRQVLRLSATYRVPVLNKLKIGMSVHWQDDIKRDQGAGITTKQSSYALLNLMARYDISDRMSATFNLNNVTDKKYITSLYWSQGFYGAPINGSVSLNWKY